MYIDCLVCVVCVFQTDYYRMLMKSDGTSVPDFESNKVEIDFGNAGDTASRRDTWRRSRRALVNHKKSVCGCVICCIRIVYVRVCFWASRSDMAHCF